MTATSRSRATASTLLVLQTDRWCRESSARDPIQRLSARRRIDAGARGSRTTHRMDADGSENYRRIAKPIVRVGDAQADQQITKALGLPLEIVPERSPARDAARGGNAASAGSLRRARAHGSAHQAHRSRKRRRAARNACDRRRRTRRVHASREGRVAAQCDLDESAARGQRHGLRNPCSRASALVYRIERCWVPCLRGDDGLWRKSWVPAFAGTTGFGEIAQTPLRSVLLSRSASHGWPLLDLHRSETTKAVRPGLERRSWTDRKNNEAAVVADGRPPDEEQKTRLDCSKTNFLLPRRSRCASAAS